MERSLDAWVEAFLDFLFWEKRVADNTILAYGQDISSFVQFLKEKEIASFGEVTLLVLEEFVSQESDRELEATSLARKISAFLFPGSRKRSTRESGSASRYTSLGKKPPPGFEPGRGGSFAFRLR